MNATHEPLLYCDSKFTSPWVLSVWTALKEKQVAFRPVLLNLARGEHRTGEYPQKTLTGKVPALRDGDVWIAESLAILEYLEESFTPPNHVRLLPARPSARARERQILSWLRSDLFEIRRCLPFEGLFGSLELPELTPKAQAELAAVAAVATTRLPMSDGGPTLADYDLAFMLRRPLHYGVPFEGREALSRWADAIWTRPSVQSWVTHARTAG